VTQISYLLYWILFPEDTLYGDYQEQLKRWRKLTRYFSSSSIIHWLVAHLQVSFAGIHRCLQIIHEKYIIWIDLQK
jgi:hypothetical protein